MAITTVLIGIGFMLALVLFVLLFTLLMAHPKKRGASAKRSRHDMMKIKNHINGDEE